MKLPTLNTPTKAVIIFWLLVLINITWALLSLHTFKFIWAVIIVVVAIVAIFCALSQFIYELFE